MKITAFTLIMIAAASLSGCALLAPSKSYIGHIPINNYNKASIDALIKDGLTTKSQLNTTFGYPVHEIPSVAAGMVCKDAASFCIYVVSVTDYSNSVAYTRSVSVYFDQNNVVKSHNFDETRLGL